MIGVLIFPDFQLLDAAGPISAFEIAMRLTGSDLAIKAIAIEPGPVRSSSGVEIMKEKGARDCASRHDAARIRSKLHTFNGSED